MRKMRNTIIYPFILMGILLMLTNGCKKDSNSSNNNIVNPIETGTVTDIDGNNYKTVKIGNQWWMAENLKTTKYRDGTSIPNVTDNVVWANLTTGAYCNYDNTASNSTTYGRLYNWYAATDVHNIAPSGWHIPADSEWTTLSNFLGGEDVAGGKLKETGTTHWNSPNTGATNETGFTALPGGLRHYNGTFEAIIGGGYWWSATEENNNFAWCRDMGWPTSSLGIGGNFKSEGFSLRCLKD
jgi:uncharacterized protein (TIGR02145 family)